MLSHKVTLWKIRRRSGRRKPYEARWTVDGAGFSASFLTKGLAENYRSDLLRAARAGESFDTDTGLPGSMMSKPVEEPDRLSWYAFAREYVNRRWPAAAANTRSSIVDGLATATLALTKDQAVELDPLIARAAVRWSVIPARKDGGVDDETEQQPPSDIALAHKLLASGTVDVADLSQPLVAQALWDSLGVKLDGTAATRDTALDRRRVVNTALEHAVARGELRENPFKHVRRKRTAHQTSVDRRVVANPDQVRELLIAMSYVGSWNRARGRRLVAFFATLYYAGVRPAEATGLRKDDCELPEKGWGLLTFAETRPSRGKKYTDSGEVHDRRGLKQREKDDVREVPIPQHLVATLRAHIQEFGTAKDGRLFRNERGGVIGSTTYTRAWQEARQLALTAQQVTSPLAGTPYDLRHAALSTWLNGGVDPTDVAERAGNSVEVLLKRYAKCLDGHRERNNRLIERALGVEDADDKEQNEVPDRSV